MWRRNLIGEPTKGNVGNMVDHLLVTCASKAYHNVLTN